MVKRLTLLSEGEISQSSEHIVDVKNDVAESLLQYMISAGFPSPDIEEADDVSDEVILYTTIGRISGSPQTLMVRIITDTDIQVQIPDRLANILGVKDFYSAGESSEALAILKRIASSIEDKRPSKINIG